MARSGSLALSCRCAHSLPARLSATSRAQPVVLSRTRTRLGTTSKADRWVLDLGGGGLLQREQRIDLSGAVVRGDGQLPGDLGAGVGLGCGEDELHLQRCRGPDVDNRRIEVEPDRLLGIRAGEPNQPRPGAARVVDEHGAGGGVGVPHAEQAGLGAHLHRDVDDRHRDLDREVLPRLGLSHGSDPQHQVDLLCRNEGGRTHPHPHRQCLLAAGQQVDRVRLDDQPRRRRRGLDTVAVDDARGIDHPHLERGGIAVHRHRDGRMFGADLQPILSPLSDRRLGAGPAGTRHRRAEIRGRGGTLRGRGRTQHGAHLVLGLRLRLRGRS